MMTTATTMTIRNSHEHELYFGRSFSMKSALSFAVAFALLTAPVLAQNPPIANAASSVPTAGLRKVNKIKNASKLIPVWNVTVAKVDDMTVYSEARERLATVDNVLENAEGQVMAIVLSVAGQRDKDVVVAPDQLIFRGDHFTTKLTRQEIRSLPAWQ
jgi:hypothetical protein